MKWIFKEHPANRYYPTRDLSLQEHFECCPDHIVFLDAESSFNSESLLYIADAVVTVLGTSGVEFAAAGGIPSILAGPSSYSGFGFTAEPRTRAEYFQKLANIENLEMLTRSQQDIARKVFLYIQQYSYVPFSWCPSCSYEETKDPNLDTYYWARIPDILAASSDKILAEFKRYMTRVHEADFSRLSRLQFPDQQR